jgi:hypothetical protein
MFPQTLEELAMKHVGKKESILPIERYFEIKRDLRIINGVLGLGLLFQILALFIR